MSMRYPDNEFTKPSIMLLRSLANTLGLDASKDPGGYGGLKMERQRLTDKLKQNLGDARLSDWDRDMIKGLE